MMAEEKRTTSGRNIPPKRMANRSQNMHSDDTQKRVVSNNSSNHKGRFAGNSKPAPPPASAKRPIAKKNTVQRNSSINIKSQTPTQRRSAKEEKRIDPSSPEVKRGIKNNHGFTVKKIDRKKRKAMFAKIVLFLLIFAVIFSMFCLIFRVVLTSKEKPEYKNISLIIGIESDDSIKKESILYEEYTKNGILYIDMMKIADKFGFTITGDHKELRFLTNGTSNEYVRFEIGSSFADINGNTIRLDSETYTKDGNLFVPISFFETYVENLDVSFVGTEKKLSVLRKTERNSLGKIVELDIGFKLKAMSPSVSVPEDELSQAIKDKTYFVTPAQ